MRRTASIAADETVAVSRTRGPGGLAGPALNSALTKLEAGGCAVVTV